MKIQWESERLRPSLRTLRMGIVAPQMRSDACISRCGTYRYALWRRWAPGPQVLFVMLNPSTADRQRNDPTIRRCIGLAAAWGYGALAVGNLFAFRTPSPKVLKRAARPVGRANDRWLAWLAAESTRVVAAWGNEGALLARDAQVRALLAPLYVLSLTRQGQPRHPLYAPGGAMARLWR
jgi:hypothetical protein